MELNITDGTEKVSKPKLSVSHKDTKIVEHRPEAMINGCRRMYDISTETDTNDFSYLPYDLKLLGYGFKIIGTEVDTDNPMWFWETIEKVTVEEGAIEANNETKKDIEVMNTGNEVKEEVKYPEADAVITNCKEFKDITALCDYTKIVFAEVFTDKKRDINSVYGEMSYIANLIKDAEFMTPEMKEKYRSTLEAEEKEYIELLKVLSASNNETIEIIRTPDSSSDSGLGTIMLAVLGVAALCGLGYAAYRHLNPADVIIDMSTMDILHR